MARTRKPIPVAIPTAVAKKIYRISLAPPAAERKRIRPKVPATATLVPKLPLTRKIIMEMSTGKVAKVIMNSLV